jgi:hypothetical protein
MVVHGNGHIYCIHSNRLIKFHHGDLYNSTHMHLPSQLNGGLVLTNGMVVTQDGMLVVKQFSFNLADLPFIVLSKTKTLKILVAICLCVCSLLYAVVGAGNRATRALKSVLLGLPLSCCLWLVVLLYGMKQQIGSFSASRFVLDGLFSNKFGGGERTIIDPAMMTGVAGAPLPERVSWSRVGVTKVDGAAGFEQSPGAEDAIILMGDEHVFQFRWRPAEKKLFWVSVRLLLGVVRYVCRLRLNDSMMSTD